MIDSMLFRLFAQLILVYGCSFTKAYNTKSCSYILHQQYYVIYLSRHVIIKFLLLHYPLFPAQRIINMFFLKGFWNDINCGLALPSICKRSSDFVNTTMLPSTVPPGGCTPEWTMFRGRVRVISS